MSRIDIRVVGNNVTIDAGAAAVDAGPMVLQLTSSATPDAADTKMQAVIDYCVGAARSTRRHRPAGGCATRRRADRRRDITSSGRQALRREEK
jgi:hypothetical protein